MGFFDRFKSSGNNASAPSSSSKQTNDDLTKVFEESVWQNVAEILKTNTNFVIRKDGKTSYIAVLMDTNQIGGFASRSAKSDESKGSVIEAIKTHRVASYNRKDMMLNSTFVIIPTKETIENMDEFTLFSEAKYVPVIIDTEGSVTTVTVDGTDDGDDLLVDFDTIKNIVRGDMSGEMLLVPKAPAIPDNAESDNNADADNTSDDDSGEELEPDPEEMPFDRRDMVRGHDIFDDARADSGDDDSDDGSDGDDNYGGYNDIPDESPSDTGVPIDESPADNSDINDDIINNIPAPAPEPDYVNRDEEDIGGVTVYQDITSDVVYEHVTRMFHSGDLDLAISTEPFDTMFMQPDNMHTLFNENRGEGYLNEQLSNMARSANAKMEELHNNNLFQLRERYMRIVQQQCVAIAEKVDDSNANAAYGQMRQTIEAAHNQNIAGIPAAIEKKRNDLEELYNKRRNEAADNAAQAARADFDNKNSDRHHRDLERLEDDERNEIDEDYNRALDKLCHDRQTEADKLLELAIGETIKQISIMYEPMKEKELKEWNKLDKQMRDFQDSNLKDEKARIAALAEDERQRQRADAVRAEYIDRIKSMQADFEIKKTVLQSDIDRLRKDHADALKLKEDEFESKYELEKTRADSLQAQVDTLVGQYSSLEERKNSEFEARLNELRTDNEMKKSEIEHLINAKRSESKIVVLLSIAVLIICIGVGVLIGHVTASADTPDNIRDTSTPIASVDVNYNSQDNSSEVNSEETEDNTDSESEVSE